MTSVMLNLSTPKRAQQLSHTRVAGVGLMRAEFLFYSSGTHPQQIIEDGGEDSVLEIISSGMRRIAQSFYPRPVRYRTLDARSDEMESLLGGDRHESREDNPALGLRGASRAIAAPEMFKLEIHALATVRGEGLRNLHVMLPFIRVPSELSYCREALKEGGLLSSGIEVWAMAEVPSWLFLIDDFAPMLDGVSVGTNDLTQFLFGVDRNNPLVADLYDDGNRALVEATSTIITSASNLGLQTAICGDRVSRDSIFLEAMLEIGVDSISVSPDALNSGLLDALLQPTSTSVDGIRRP